MSNDIIQTFNLSKVYKLKGKKKGITALDNVNISVKEGEIFGLLGPNGAGKTTMIQILTTLLQPTRGYAIIDGYNIIKKPIRAKNRVALMLESDMLYYRITGFDNLKFFCKIYEVKNWRDKISRLAADLGLTEWLNQYVETYSSGMKMKLALCRTLLLERKILFLDEPTLGLDVNTKSFMINKLKEVDNTIFLTSHDMSVVEKLCDRIAFINNGKIIQIGTQNKIKNLMQRNIKILIDIEGDNTNLVKELNKLNFIEEITHDREGIVISLKNRNNYKDLLSILGNFNIKKIKELDLSLDDLFMILSNQK